MECVNLEIGKVEIGMGWLKWMIGEGKETGFEVKELRKWGKVAGVVYG